jgi:hypothetical protein
MSVAINIIRPRTKADQMFYVPVAGQRTFDQVWAPAAENLGLYWMPQFSTGLSVEKSDMPAVRAEFIAMRDWFDANTPDRELADFLMGRADMAIRAIEETMRRSDDVKLSIG